ncbi:MAG: PD40 domain-containing protein [Candidatus Eisenbacteria bacterium]|nr:PD40 domain-containing protein [Candidatus Eisenbacteria bacterium]
MNLRSTIGVLAAASALVLLAHARDAEGQCGNRPLSPIPGPPNVFWSLKDSVSACPAGDSLLNTGHPSRLRILINYSDVCGYSKVGVPPESIWVTLQSTTGNLKINDEGAKIFADDSTDGGGYARVTIPSFSGNGGLTVRVVVSGVDQGPKSAKVRTTDTNADGRTDSNDTSGFSDLNYDGGTPGAADLAIVLQHGNPKHWHRNALFGTLVQRTSMCTNCVPGTTNTLGGELAWSPNGHMLCTSVHSANSDCHIYLIPSDPAVGGNGLIPFSHPLAGGPDDYSPCWSPLNNVIVFNRGDHDFYTKGIPGQNPDTTEHLIPVSSSLLFLNDSSLSPDGGTIAFAGTYSGGLSSIYTVPVAGGTPTSLTSGPGAYDDFPQWSPDGSTIAFYRSLVGGPRLYTVPAAGGPVQALASSDNNSAALPSYAPDGAVVLYGRGTNRTTATLDASIANGALPVDNYPGYVQSLLVPKLSPDGTRLALRAVKPWAPTENPQLWAVRRNMNLPPVFGTFGGQTLAESTAVVPVSVIEGLQYTAVVSAADPEGDPLTYAMYFPQTGMSFDAPSRTFTWTPPSGTAGHIYNVKFVVGTPSGGADAFIAPFTVQHGTQPMHASQSAAEFRVITVNPVRTRFAVVAGSAGASAMLEVFDASGREVAQVRGAGGGVLAWDLNGRTGNRVAPGVFFYSVHSGTIVHNGKVVVVR